MKYVSPKQLHKAKTILVGSLRREYFLNTVQYKERNTYSSENLFPPSQVLLQKGYILMRISRAERGVPVEMRAALLSCHVFMQNVDCS